MNFIEFDKFIKKYPKCMSVIIFNYYNHYCKKCSTYQIYCDNCELYFCKCMQNIRFCLICYELLCCKHINKICDWHLCTHIPHSQCINSKSYLCDQCWNDVDN